MSNPFLAGLTEKRQAKTDLIEATLNAAAESDRDLTEAELANVEALSTEARKLDERITVIAEIETRNAKAAELAAKIDGATETRATGGARITSEEPTYSVRSEHNFLTDALNASFGWDSDAQQRMNRYNREVSIERRDIDTSNFAGLVVPQYLVDMYAPLARAGRPTADIVRKHALPAQGMTVNISRVTTGVGVEYQAAENDIATETNMDDTLLTVNVNTLTGMQDVSKQAILRGAMVEEVVLADLVKAYHTKLDFGILNGTGSSGTPTGLTTLSGTVSVTYTDATPTVAELYPKLLDGIQQIQSSIFQGPSHIIMHPRRLGWLLAATDTTGRPLVVPVANGPMNAAGTYSGLGYGQSGQYSIVGLPIITDANVATNLGAGTNQDEIYIVAADELHLWEAPGQPTYVRFEQPDGRNAIRIVMFGFSAFTAGRYPKATAKIGGTGLVTPTF